jgi:hypothetical protein
MIMKKMDTLGNSVWVVEQFVNGALYNYAIYEKYRNAKAGRKYFLRKLKKEYDPLEIDVNISKRKIRGTGFTHQKG